MSSIPTDTGLAYVIVQHLSPDHESNLGVILQRFTDMPVRVLDKSTLLQPNIVYVRPPDKDVYVDEGLRVVPRRQVAGEVYLPIDEFLISLAGHREQGAIGVVFSGMGSDGSRGVKEIKEKGGMIFVQSVQSAEFSGMPSAALRHKVADFVGTPEEIAAKIAAIPHYVAVAPEDKPPLLTLGDDHGEFIAEVLDLIARQKQMSFHQYRPSTIRRRTEKRLLIHQLSSYQAYLELLHRDPDEVDILAESYLIGVTRFFRDQDAFRLLRQAVVPQLAKIAAARGTIRIWVPACSTGEEAYTIAMIVDEYLTENRIAADFKILASDVDERAIETAGAGRYPDEVRADVPRDYLNRYFRSTMNGFQILPYLRDKILFAVQNLLTDPPFIRIDLLICRNFLIYVNNEAQASILSNFHFALNPNGFMMLGPSESLGRIQRSFTVVNRRWKVFARPPGKRVPAVERAAPLPPPEPGAERNREAGVATFNDLPKEPTITEQMTDHYAQYLSDQFAPSAVFVDAQYQLLYLNGKVDRLLRFPRHFAELTLDTVFSVEVGNVLKAAVDNLLGEPEPRGGNEVNVEQIVIEDRPFRVRVSLAELETEKTPVALLEFSDLDPAAIKEARSGQQYQTDELLQQKISNLQHRLDQSERRAQKLLAELEATNEELQTSNRELLASNEEMQSTNEELQSVNEELYTVNSESQLKNDQLRALNSDINHLLESTEIGTLFLDQHLNIRRFTPSIRRQFNLHAADVGRPLSAFASSFPSFPLLETCREVLETSARFEREIVDTHGNNYLMRILPYLDQEDTVTGLIVTFIDIKDLVRTRLQLKDMADKYAAIARYSEDTIAVVDRSSKIYEINQWLTDQDPAELEGRYLIDLIADEDQQVRFNNALRQLFTQGKAQQESIRVSEQNGRPSRYVIVHYLPLTDSPTAGAEGREPTALLVVRDVTSPHLDRERNQKLLAEYRRRITASSIQEGILDTEGMIIDLNRSHSTQIETEEFIQRNVVDFMTPSGRKKVRQAFDNLRNGSFEEIVTYYPEDLTVDGPEKGLRIRYQPLIVNGEVAFFSIRNLNQFEEKEALQDER